MLGDCRSLISWLQATECNQIFATSLKTPTEVVRLPRSCLTLLPYSSQIYMIMMVSQQQRSPSQNHQRKKCKSTFKHVSKHWASKRKKSCWKCMVSNYSSQGNWLRQTNLRKPTVLPKAPCQYYFVSNKDWKSMCIILWKFHHFRMKALIPSGWQIACQTKRWH